MAKVLRDLFYGNLFPGERYCTNDGEIRKKLGEVELLRKELQGELSEKGKAVLKKYEDTVSEANVLACEDHFICGYRLGARMMAEVFSSEE